MTIYAGAAWLPIAAHAQQPVMWVVDQPEIERKVPCLVMDADSSQFSTLVDIAEGKNLAVEGPPEQGNRKPSSTRLLLHLPMARRCCS
jgi:hypothetical protein